MQQPQNNSNIQQAVPFFMAVNVEKSLDFYVKGLGFELKNKWEPNGTIEWCWLALDGVAIMLQEYRKDVPVETRGLGVSVCFMCKDALAYYKQLISNGLSPDEPFVGNLLWVVGIKDPDGYNLFFESPTDVPEGTRYSKFLSEK